MNVLLPLVLTSASVSGFERSHPNSRMAAPASSADPRAVDLSTLGIQSRWPDTDTYSLISGLMTSKPPVSAKISIQASPLVIPPSTLRCLRSVLESSFILSNIALVWKALASIAARAICAGVVYDDSPVYNLDRQFLEY